MTKHLFIPVAALIALACSEATSPSEANELTPSYGKSDPDPAPAAVCNGGSNCATWDDEVGTLAASSYGISSFDVASAPSGEKFSGRFSTETVTFVLPNAGQTVDVRFKLYIVGAWAGEEKRQLPHVWELSTQCANAAPTEVIYASFSNRRGGEQSYPYNMSENQHNGGYAGHSALDALGYRGSGQTAYFNTKTGGDVADATYNIARTLTNNCEPGDFRIIMRAHNLAGMSVNSWGVDNLSID
jgi:hypothetical protein